MRIVHKADKANGKGGVSGLCFSRPRSINMKSSSWVLTASGVTCKKCLALLKELKER